MQTWRVMLSDSAWHAPLSWVAAALAHRLAAACTGSIGSIGYRFQWRPHQVVHDQAEREVRRRERPARQRGEHADAPLRRVGGAGRGGAVWSSTLLSTPLFSWGSLWRGAPARPQAAPSPGCSKRRWRRRALAPRAAPSAPSLRGCGALRDHEGSPRQPLCTRLEGEHSSATHAASSCAPRLGRTLGALRHLGGALYAPNPQ